MHPLEAWDEEHMEACSQAQCTLSSTVVCLGIRVRAFERFGSLQGVGFTDPSSFWSSGGRHNHVLKPGLLYAMIAKTAKQSRICGPGYMGYSAAPASSLECKSKCASWKKTP